MGLKGTKPKPPIVAQRPTRLEGVALKPKALKTTPQKKEKKIPAKKLKAAEINLFEELLKKFKTRRSIKCLSKKKQKTN